jgi:hypothetical protein
LSHHAGSPEKDDVHRNFAIVDRKAFPFST